MDSTIVQAAGCTRRICLFLRFYGVFDRQNDLRQRLCATDWILSIDDEAWDSADAILPGKKQVLLYGFEGFPDVEMLLPFRKVNTALPDAVVDVAVPGYPTGN